MRSRAKLMLLGLLVTAPAVMAFSNINTEVDFQFIPATSTTPGGYYDVCPLNSYLERNPPVGPMNVTNCGCPAGYTLRPTARSEGTSDNSLPTLGGGLQCKQNDELACVDCEHYVRSTAAEKLETLWNHIMSSPLMANDSTVIGKNQKWEASDPDGVGVNKAIYDGLCNATVTDCVYLSSLTMTDSTGSNLPTDSVEHTAKQFYDNATKPFWGKGRTGRETFPRFTTLYTESMDASFDRYADVLPKGRVKAIHNHGVVTKVKFAVSKTAKILDQISKTLKPASGFFAEGSDNCILRSSISHPINTTCGGATYPEQKGGANSQTPPKMIDACANNGLLASTALKCLRDGTYSANILGLQDARGQGPHANWFATQLKNWVPSYNPSMPSFGGVGPNAERFGTSTDQPLRMSLDQFSVAGEDGTENIEGISQPEILYWVPNGCTKGVQDTTSGLYGNGGSCVPFDVMNPDASKNTGNWIYDNPYQNDDKSTAEYDFRDDLMKMPSNMIMFDLYAPSTTEGACYCTTIDKNLYGWGYDIGITPNQPCPVINSNDPDLKCTKSYVKVAQIITDSPTVMSGWSDTQMFFQHGRYGKKENRVCRFDNAIPNDNKGVVHPARFSYDHHLACVAGQQCPDGSHEVNLNEAQPTLPNNHPTITGKYKPAVGCPFANALLPTGSGLAGEAYPRPLPKGNCPAGDTSECEVYKCPEHSFATQLDPQSSAHCLCFDGYELNADKNGCIPTGPYSNYNPVGLRGFFGFEISVPNLNNAIAFWEKLGFKKTDALQQLTLPNKKTLTRQLMRLLIDKSGAAIAIELTEMQGSLPPTAAGADKAYYGYEQISFSVQDAESAYRKLVSLGIKNAGADLTAPVTNQRMGFTSFTFTDDNQNKFEIVEDFFGGDLGTSSTSPAHQSFWDEDVPTQPARTTAVETDFNPVGLGGIRAIHELVPETSAAQIWQMDTLNMTLWQFEAPQLEALAENFNDCYQNPQLRVSQKECTEAARLFPGATVGLGQMRVVYTFKGNANAGFVGNNGGSFIRPPPPYHNAYHGVSHVSYQVDLLDRSMQALAQSDIEIISPEASANPKSNFGFKSVYFATNSKAYVKLVQPNTDAGSSIAGGSPYDRLTGTPQFGEENKPPVTCVQEPPNTPFGTTNATNTTAAASDGYRQATIGLAVVLALLVTGGFAVVYARRQTAGKPGRWQGATSFSTKRESSVNLKTPAGDSTDVNVEMSSMGNMDEAAAAQKNPAYE